ncbi:MAG TPA: NAD-dependent epimerase/dehydratase family protein [Verrucomicrobiae bacterium]
MSHVLVTGGSGFVGKALVRHLVGRGYAVRATYRSSAPEEIAGVEWVHTKDVAGGDFAGLLKDCDFVVHLAALAHQLTGKVPEGEFDRVNHRATAELAQAVADSATVKRMVFVSSIGAVCSASEKVVTERTECRPDSEYGRSKRDAEVAVEKILAGTRADYCVIRPPLVYGRGNPGNMLRLLKLTKSPVPLPLGSIRNRRTFIYVGNLVDVIEKALTHPKASRRIFNVADSEVLSTPELIRELARVRGTKARLMPMPGRMLRAMGKVGDVVGKVVRRSVPIDTYSVDRLLGSLEIDSAEVRRELNWSPPYSTREGLKLTLAE